MGHVLMTDNAHRPDLDRPDDGDCPQDKDESAADEITVFPEPLENDDHDPLGIEVASHIAHDIAGILPPPRGVSSSRRRRRRFGTEQRSGAGPDERDPKPLSQALNRLVSGRGWQTEVGLRRLLETWPEIVGPVNAQHSQPAGFENKVLAVRAESSTWATVLRQMAPQIVAKLNTELGDGSVQRIDVRGPAAPSWSHGRRSIRGSRGPRDTYG